MSNGGIRPTHCPLCGATVSFTLRFVKRGFPIYHCGCCQVLFVWPQPTPDELASLYGADYFRRGNKYCGAERATTTDPNRDNDLAKLELLRRYQPDGRLLDVGCAMGGFLAVAREQGYDVSGVELSAYAANHARHSLGIEVANCDLLSAGLSAAHYDLITLWDVIEHLADPVATIAEVSRLLRPGGVVALSTGDAGSAWARLSGRYWQLLTPPQHLFYHTESSLRLLLSRQGLDTIEMRHMGKCTTVEFVLFKARETLGAAVAPLAGVARWTGLSHCRVRLNLGDIVTCIARKGTPESDHDR